MTASELDDLLKGLGVNWYKVYDTMDPHPVLILTLPRFRYIFKRSKIYKSVRDNLQAFVELRIEILG